MEEFVPSMSNMERFAHRDLLSHKGLRRHVARAHM